MKIFCRSISLLFCFIGLNLTIFISKANACSVSSDYYKLSNFELIESSDAIVVAKVIGRQKEDSEDRIPSAPVFQITHHIKNKSVAEIGPSRMYVSMGPIGKTKPSVPDNISDPHPDSFSGACNRSVVTKGRSYILFLNEHGGKFYVGGNAFSRIAEDYYGPDSDWMKAINFYLEIQNNYRRYNQLEFLKVQYDKYKLEPKGSFEYKLSLDIADHLMSRSPYKPTQYLLETYEALENEKKLPFAIRPPDQNPEYANNPEMKGLESLIMGEVKNNDEGTELLRENQKNQTLKALALGDHPGSVSLFKRLIEEGDAPVLTYAYYFQILGKAEKYSELIAAADPLAYKFVASEDISDAAKLVSALQSEMRDYGDDIPKWKRNVETIDWWPKFELGLVKILNQRSNDGWRLNKDIFDDVRPKDYRSDPELTLLLAESYDKPVKAWAKKEVWRLIESDTIAFDKEFNLPIGVLLRTHRPDDMSDIEAIFCNKSKGRGAILKSFGLHSNVYADDFAYRIAAHQMEDQYFEYLTKSLYILAGNDWEDYATKRSWGSDRYSDLIEVIHRKEEINLAEKKLKPIRCPTD